MSTAQPLAEPAQKELQAQRLKVLQRQFQLGLAARADELQALIGQPARLHEGLHRLVGAAGAYGELELAAAARSLMHACAPNQRPAHALDSTQLQTQLHTLCTLCRQRAALAQPAATTAR